MPDDAPSLRHNPNYADRPYVLQMNEEQLIYLREALSLRERVLHFQLRKNPDNRETWRALVVLTQLRMALQ